LVIVLPRVGITERSWKLTLLFLGLLAPSALTSDLIISYGGRAFDFVQLVLQPSVNLHQMQDTADVDPGSSMQRIWAAGPAAGGMLLALLCLVPMRRFFQLTGIHWLLLFALIVCLSLVSGFRLMTASIFLIAALTLFFQKGFTAPRMVILAIAGCIGLASIYLFATHLPLSAQRAVSWLPYIEVNASASADATGTVDWRLRLWREAFRDLPQYWLIGKGFSYDKVKFISAMLSNDDLKWALLTGSYHNGWLSMLLCTGIVGTILCLAVMGGSVRRHWKRQFSPWHNPQLQRYHGVFLAGLIANVGIFLVIYGDVHVSFPGIFFHLAVLESLSATDRDSTPHLSKEPEESEYAESTYQS
jgi:O-antigen ligase